jgi:hypothetical protein
MDARLRGASALRRAVEQASKAANALPPLIFQDAAYVTQ